MEVESVLAGQSCALVARGLWKLFTSQPSGDVLDGTGLPGLRLRIGILRIVVHRDAMLCAAVEPRVNAA